MMNMLNKFMKETKNVASVVTGFVGTAVTSLSMLNKDKDKEEQTDLASWMTLEDFNSLIDEINKQRSEIFDRMNYGNLSKPQIEALGRELYLLDEKYYRLYMAKKAYKAINSKNNRD